MITKFDELVHEVIAYFKKYGQDNNFNKYLYKIVDKGQLGADIMEEIVTRLVLQDLYLPKDITYRIYPSTFATYYFQNLSQLTEDDIRYVIRTNNLPFILNYSKKVTKAENIKLIEDVVINSCDVGYISTLATISTKFDRQRLRQAAKVFGDEAGLNAFDNRQIMSNTEYKKRDEQVALVENLLNNL